VDECAARLAAANQAVDEARLGREAEQRARALEQEHKHEVEHAESWRLHGGYARASDLARAADFVQGARFRELQIERRLKSAEDRERQALRVHDDAQRELHEAEAARVALQRFGDRRQLQERKRSELRADGEVADDYNLRQRKAER
jgi:hypothetical protein